MPYCQQRAIGMIAYSALAQGILTGKYPRDYRPGNADARGIGLFPGRRLAGCVCGGVGKEFRKQMA